MNNYNEIPFHGLKIILNRQMVTTKQIDVERTWKERLFSWPWNPFKKTKIMIINEPIKTIYSHDDKLIMHPEVFKEFREQYINKQTIYNS